MMVMGPHAGLGNFPRAVEYTSDWVTALIRSRARPWPDTHRRHARGGAAWTDHVIETNEGLLFTEVDSWMTGINRNLEGKQVRRVMRYSGGHPAFRQHCDAVSTGRLPGTVDGVGLEPDWKPLGTSRSGVVGGS